MPKFAIFLVAAVLLVFVGAYLKLEASPGWGPLLGLGIVSFILGVYYLVQSRRSRREQQA